MNEPLSLFTGRQRILLGMAMLFATVFPTVAAWSYFVELAKSPGSSNSWQQLAYVGGKIVQ